MKLRRHLAWMVTAVLVPVALSSGLALDSLLDAERDAVLRSMREAARATSLGTDRKWSFAAGVANALATSAALDNSDFTAF